MKKYTKPVAEVKNFAVVNKIADLTDWVTNEAAQDVTFNADASEVAVFSFSVAS